MRGGQSINAQVDFTPLYRELDASVLWTALHAGYSWPGLVSVFLAGIGLSWIMRRTGSMKAVILAHAVINAFALAVISTFA